MELGPSRKALCSTLRTVKDHRTKNEEAGPRDASTHLEETGMEPSTQTAEKLSRDLVSTLT